MEKLYILKVMEVKKRQTLVLSEENVDRGVVESVVSGSAFNPIGEYYDQNLYEFEIVVDNKGFFIGAEKEFRTSMADHKARTKLICVGKIEQDELAMVLLRVVEKFRWDVCDPWFDFRHASERRWNDIYFVSKKREVLDHEGIFMELSSLRNDRNLRKEYSDKKGKEFDRVLLSKEDEIVRLFHGLPKGQKKVLKKAPKRCVKLIAKKGALAK